MLLSILVTTLLAASASTTRCNETTNCGINRQCSIYGWCENITTAPSGLFGAQPITFGSRMWSGNKMIVGLNGVDQNPIITTYRYQPPNARMTQHGGRVMNTSVFSIYVLYYGDYWSKHEKDTIEFFLKWSGYSTTKPDPWSSVSDYNHYENGVYHWAAYPRLSDGKTIYHKPSTGKVILTDDDVANYIKQAITDRNLAKDPVGIYLFIGGKEIRQQSASLNGTSCKDFCGWHNWMNGGGGYSPSIDMNFNYYAYVQHPGTDGQACWLQCGNRLNTQNSYFNNGVHTSPNGDVAADQLVDIIFHELAEFVTNANGNAWFDTNTKDESADMCSEFYGVLNDRETIWNSTLEPGTKSYYSHVPMLARYNPSTTTSYHGPLPYYYNTEVFDMYWAVKRRFLLSAIYNPAEQYWQTNGPWGYPIGCTTGHATRWH